MFPFRRTTVQCLALCLGIGVVTSAGCDGGTEEPSSVEEGQSNANDGATGVSDGLGENDPASDGQTATRMPTDCATTADATLLTDMGELVYTDATAVATATHNLGNGCITQVSLDIAQDNGCELSLTLQTLDGMWSLTGGALTVDAACGTELAGAAEGTYSLDVSGSTGGLDGQPTVAAPSQTGCEAGESFDFTGLALFKEGDTKALSVNLNGLMLRGEVLSSVGTDTACPAEIPSCTDRTCGTDDYGKSCGSCAEGEACLDGGCMVWNCPPEGPFGTTPGESLTNAELRDCDGNTVWLHELCGADAAFFNLLAGW
ncbi:MAG: hypothetical protein ACPGU1_06905 [Myxococcota bacterium]